MVPHRYSRTLVILACALSAGCGPESNSDPIDAGQTPDSGGTANRDAGAAPDDIGASSDFGQPPDDAERDRFEDTGESSDSGAIDAGGDDPACTDPFDVVMNPPAQPPYSGTAFITDELITENDPTSFADLSYGGTGQRQMFDRRAADFITVDAHLFDAQFGSGTTVEVQVNPEFSQADAESEARKYAEVIGRLPGFLFRDIETVWIHAGNEAFGGGNRNLLIHTERGVEYAAANELEEIFVHEAVHTSLDAYHSYTPRYEEARTADGVALSTYAHDNRIREDLAETLGPYLAVRFRRDRIDPAVAQTIEATVPARLTYLDCLDLSMDVLQ